MNKTSINNDVEIDATFDVDKCEGLLREFAENNNGVDLTLKLVASFSSIFFSELWVAILLGSLCRTRREQLRVVAWGLFAWRDSPYFVRSLPGIVALQMSRSVVEDGSNISILPEEVFINRNRWKSKQDSAVRTVVELEPQMTGLQPLNGAALKRYLLESLSDLEVGYAVRGFQIGEQNEMVHLITFVNELYENAYNYSSTDKGDDRGVRFLRIRNHLSNTKHAMVDRAGTDNILRGYMAEVLHGPGKQGLIEITVSDFGPGILNHFLRSPKGGFYNKEQRRSLLHDIIHYPLSSKADQGAGEGLPKAIRAARGLRGFISVRTDRYRFCQSFADKAKSELEPAAGTFGPVAGSHWQLLWPIIGL